MAAVSCAIVGMPNVGKSTIFNAITDAGAEVANYPFCTIQPNRGRIGVPDSRLDTLCKLIQPEQRIPAWVEFVDVAGLVKGASEGEGLGNQFLGQIRESDAILHIVRCFLDDQKIHVNSKVDPIADIEIIELELILSDQQSLDRMLKTASGKKRALAVPEEKLNFSTQECLQKVSDHLAQGIQARFCPLSVDERKWLKQFHLLTDLPVLFVCNVSEGQIPEEEKWADQVRNLAGSRGDHVLVLQGMMAAQISALPELEQQEYLAIAGIKEQALYTVIRSTFSLLNQQVFFTAGVQEVRAWNIRKTDTALQAADQIHSDISRGFIRAEVVNYNDFVRLNGSWSDARKEGKIRLEGKKYQLADGEVVYFRFHV